MTDNAPEEERARPSLGQAIDQCISALEHFKATERQTILRAVYAQLNIAPPQDDQAGSQRREEERLPPAPGAGAKLRDEYAGMDIRAFKESKSPTSARQMACVVAYYLAEVVTGEEHKKVINKEDLEKYFKQAKYPLPNKLDQLLIDTKGSGYIEPSGERGEYKLTRVGHNLVAHQLPAKGK